ncbi:MAG TPA: pilus assembly protein PilP [Myxococcota bacterium]
MLLKNAPRLLLIGALLASVVACGEEEEEVPVAVPKKKKDDAPVVAEPEKRPEDQSYSYEVMVNGQPRRDPFNTYYQELTGGPDPVDTSKLTELQKIELDKLKLVAVVVGTATPMAMVEDASGRGHTLKIGTLVGKRLGQVKHIRRGEVIVQEEFRDFTGKRIPQLKELKLEESTATLAP